MAILVTDLSLQQRLIAERETCGADRYDEVWEGVYMMAPMPNDEHQQMVMLIASILQETVGWPGLGEVRPGVNLSGSEENWEHNYRVPDVAVFLRDGAAENCGTHWRGAADLLVEITSPGDRTREKISFCSRIGAVELLLVDRDAWAIELYQRREDQLQIVGRSDLNTPNALASATVPLTFQFVPGEVRPQIEVAHAESERRWLV